MPLLLSINFKNFQEKLNKKLCEIFNHKWEYNFPSLPSKRTCSRCGQKQKVKYNDKFTNPLVDFETWEDIN